MRHKTDKERIAELEKRVGVLLFGVLALAISLLWLYLLTMPSR